MKIIDKKEIFTSLYESHWLKLYLHAYRMVEDEDEAKDIVQEVFTNLWDILDTIDINSSYSSYLYRSIRNVVINRLSRGKLAAKFEAYIQAAQLTDYAYTPDDLLREKDLAEIINYEIENLPPKMAVIFKKSRFEDLSYREIAAELNISENTVRKQIHNALVILRKKIKFILIFFYY
ncbi:RNA polymerase sigma-70 factor [Sphingobacterium psychroaquaticum]|uniref:RNA polymerase sigma-70 factor, ECF subfamily n=1 Tax=Sphingobacterium psychroaquaticum TaxID=561061 RepID=A0A1X7I5X3_9SPHI|nr:RNA polymerase sigma-70 factor [Sphingobacterium psychroaquaticum]QBQ41887.1 RNA polymerase sigma-70 factor [Sphingobacterium psychroaquaticum]SMG09878.1 RNA polymerase sigma-70 factor, ECF subfamily [Sphingobacterium psychroaquaticum]